MPPNDIMLAMPQARASSGGFLKFVPEQVQTSVSVRSRLEAALANEAANCAITTAGAESPRPNALEACAI